jgi:nitroimidazol reductase NimA-like FMN-containing flavoprotein (pyridoxamine 5'-phosphate oxidase superfamily)
MPVFEKGERNRLLRVPERAHYDSETIHQIIDDALFCHVGIVQDGIPFVIPTIHARRADKILLHGAKASRLLKHVAEGHTVCVTMTLLDGLVMARSAFHHSMNYRSAVIFGRGRLVEEAEDKLHCLEMLSNHVASGRWEEVRLPNQKEMKATSVVELSIESATAKIRTGPPVDDDDDYRIPVWAGVVPIQQQFLPPIPDPRLASPIEAPDYIVNYHR